MLPVRSSLLITTLCFSLQACSLTPAQPEGPETLQGTATRLQVELLLQNPERQPAVNVQVRLRSGRTLLRTLTSNDRGAVLLEGLNASQPYLLELNHPDFVPLTRQLDLRELPAESALKVVLSRWVQRLSGTVRDAQGQPLAEVNLQAGDAVAVSDADGHFVLYTSALAGQLQAFRQGYLPGQSPLQAGVQDDLQLQLSTDAQTPRLRLDDAWKPLGLPAAAQAEAWAGALSDAQAQGYSLLAWEAEALDPARDMLWLRSPSQALDENRQQEIEDFVQAGGKLWVNTEWAGFGGFEANSTQRLLARFGLAPGNDSLRQSPGGTDLEIQHFAPHYLTHGLSSLRLQHAASVGLYQAAQGALLAWSSGDVFRILQRQPAPQGVLAVQYVGLGKVGVLSDSSLWLSTQGAYNEADHRTLWLNCLSW